MITVHGLQAKDSHEELIDLNFQLDSGSVLAVIGRFDSGKNLLGRVMAGMVEPLSGILSYNHYNLISTPVRSRAMLGYLSNPATLELALTGYEYLDLIGSYYHLEPKTRQNLIEQFSLELNFNADIYTLLEYSHPSVRQKVAIAAATIHSPRLLILDDPLNQLDLIDQMVIKKFLNRFIDSKNNLILITDSYHLIEEFADKLLVLNKGSLNFIGTAKQLINQVGSGKDLSKALNIILEQ